MVREELHMRHLDMFPQAMKLHTIRVVNVDILLLRDRKVLVVVKPAGITYRLAQLQFTPELPLSPIHRRNMAFPPRQQQVPPISRIVAHIWPKILQLQLKPLLHRLDGDTLLNLILADLVRALELGFGLEESAGVLQKDLGLLGPERGSLVLVLEGREVPP